MSDAPSTPVGRYRSNRCHRGWFFPLIIIALGVVFLCDQMNWIAADRVFAYFWPLVFIIFGLEAMSNRPSRHRFLLGLGALTVGVVLLGNHLSYWYLDIGRLWPLLLIFVGLSMLFRPYSRRTRWPSRSRRSGIFADSPASPGTAAPAAAGESDETFLDAVAVLGGYNRRITSSKFTGGHLTAFFGGLQVDLTQADIAGPEAVLDITAVMGGAEVRVPNTWEIDMQGQPFLGGFSDETHQLPARGAKRLIVRGTAFMGGVNIKN